jgi:hypothetical protein
MCRFVRNAGSTFLGRNIVVYNANLKFVAGGVGLSLPGPQMSSNFPDGFSLVAQTAIASAE